MRENAEDVRRDAIQRDVTRENEIIKLQQLLNIDPVYVAKAYAWLMALYQDADEAKDAYASILQDAYESRTSTATPKISLGETGLQ